MGMLDAPIRRIAASPLERLADALANIGVNANALTISGFAMGLAAAALIADSLFLQALIFLALNRLIDVLDGMVARRTRTTELGAFLDSTLDLFFYAAIPFAFALVREQDALAAAFLLMGLMVAAIPGLAARAFAPGAAETRGAPVHPFALVGHSETFLAFALMCVAPRWMFSPLAYFYGVLCIFSGVTRVVSVIGHFGARAKP
jgi:phosphatidylglycerophosphate synthase